MTDYLQLAVGARLGPYEIVSPLGNGGSASARALAPRALRRDLAVAHARTLIW